MKRGFGPIGSALVIGGLLVCGCAESKREIPPEIPSAGSMPQSGPPPGSDPAGVALGRPAASPITTIMRKVGVGPSALTTVIGQSLKEENLAWDTVQTHAKEYLELTTNLANEKPPQGSDESWATLTAAFKDLATQLAQAAEKQDKDAALAAHTQIAAACAGCHKEHRPSPPTGGPGGGGPGRGGPPGGGPGGGGPPGGGGSPPGGAPGGGAPGAPPAKP